MTTINFKPGPKGVDIHNNGKRIEKLLSFTQKDDGSIWAVCDGDTSAPVRQVYKNLSQVRATMAGWLWVEVVDGPGIDFIPITITIQQNNPQNPHGCECGSWKPRGQEHSHWCKLYVREMP